MATYRELYLHLFNQLETAIEWLNKGEPDIAKSVLITAQNEAEDIFCEWLCQVEVIPRKKLNAPCFGMVVTPLTRGS